MTVDVQNTRSFTFVDARSCIGVTATASIVNTTQTCQPDHRAAASYCRLEFAAHNHANLARCMLTDHTPASCSNYILSDQLYWAKYSLGKQWDKQKQLTTRQHNHKQHGLLWYPFLPVKVVPGYNFPADGLQHSQGLPCLSAQPHLMHNLQTATLLGCWTSCEFHSLLTDGLRNSYWTRPANFYTDNACQALNSYGNCRWDAC